MPKPGEIWLDNDFFDGQHPKRKYLLVLAVDQGDITHRHLTSRQYSRPEDPACYHGNPYPGFFLGVLGDPLVKNSWLDLSFTDDLDAVAFAKMERVNRLGLVMTLAGTAFCAALRCTINAPDTTGRQARRMGDVVQALGCP